MRRREFVVIGLGRFGSSLALELAARGQSVLGVDADREVVQKLSSHLTDAAVLDATAEEALREAGVQDFDVAVVGIGTDFEANVLVTSTLKDLGVPRILCKALTDRQKRILLNAGASEVILPEHEAGVRLAHRLTSPQETLERLELAEGISVSEFPCPRGMLGSSLGESQLRARFGVTLLMIKGLRTVLLPAASEVLREGDVLVAVGRDDDLRRLQEAEA